MTSTHTPSSPAEASLESASAAELDAYFVPKVMEGNPYQALLKRGLESIGVRVDVKQELTGKLIDRIAKRSERRPQVLHLHWTGQFMIRPSLGGSIVATARFLSRVWRARRSGARVVWTIHNLVQHESERRTWERWALTAQMRLVHKGIVHSEAAARETARCLRFPAERLAIVPHGDLGASYPNTISREEARQRLGVAAESKVVLFFGRLRRFKGVPELVDAFSRIEERDAVLLVAGEEWEPETVEYLQARAATDPRIRLYIAFLPPEDVQIYMNAADVVALPFLDGITSGSATLAMSFGKALVAADAPSLVGVPPEGGAIFYKGRDPDGLQRALESALRADLVAMGARNREEAQRWDWGTVARMTRAVYEDRA
jgi:beta-1,4-mannosyltransferase